MRDNAINNHLVRLLHRTEPMATVAGIAILAPSGAELAVVAASADWQYVDFAKTPAIETLRAAVAAARRLVVRVSTDGQTLDAPIDLLVRAVVDGRRTGIDLGDGMLTDRPAGQSVVLLCDGLASVAEAGPALQRIPYWDAV
jgi:hypothetical protein